MTVTATPPVPASATIVSNIKQTYSNQTWTSCDGTENRNNVYGYRRCVIYQVKESSGADIQENLAITEAVSTVDAGNITVNSHVGNSSSNPAGQFLDEPALFGASAIRSDACNIVKQSFTATGNSSAIRVNCIQYGATDVTITDVTSNPGLCVKGTTYHCN